MRVLLLASAFNGLTQRLQRELTLLGHAIAVEIAGSAASMEEAVALFCPELIVCPFLKQRIPESIWKKHTCLIVHPGIEGDRGPSSLDWAIKRAAPQWGVTLLQASEEMDAGSVWGTANFPLREASKGSIYRREVTEHATRLVLAALHQASDQRFCPRALDYNNPEVIGRLNRPMRQEDRRIDWCTDSTASIVQQINAADSAPGVLDEIGGRTVYLYGAHKALGLDGAPGALIAHSHGAICRATVDGAVWISHLKCAAPGPQRSLKLPATQVIDGLGSLPHLQTDGIGVADIGCNEIRYYEIGEAGYLHFDFYNGAMNTAQCQRLTAMLARIRLRPVKVIALMGGEEFWSNGIHLNCIETAPNPADESWANINAMNDVVKQILATDKQLTVAVMRTNAGAGGAIMAAACDAVWVRAGVVVNAHYQTMGLYGSEYWTYLLPRRLGVVNARRLTNECLPMLAREARELGFADRLLPEEWANCHREVDRELAELTQPGTWRNALNAKRKSRARDERRKPLQAYRDEELQQMRRIFYDPASAYHNARRDFVYKTAAEGTPPRIAPHRAQQLRRTA